MKNILTLMTVLVIPIMLFGCGKDGDISKVADDIANKAEKLVEKSIDDFVNNVELKDGCVQTILVGKTVQYCDERLNKVDKLVKDGFEILESAE